MPIIFDSQMCLVSSDSTFRYQRKQMVSVGLNWIWDYRNYYGQLYRQRLSVALCADDASSEKNVFCLKTCME